jgi:hypothetical protein
MPDCLRSVALGLEQFLDFAKTTGAVSAEEAPER